MKQIVNRRSRPLAAELTDGLLRMTGDGIAIIACERSTGGLWSYQKLKYRKSVTLTEAEEIRVVQKVDISFQS